MCACVKKKRGGGEEEVVMAGPSLQAKYNVKMHAVASRNLKSK